jgi:hypothetical protein
VNSGGYVPRGGPVTRHGQQPEETVSITRHQPDETPDWPKSLRQQGKDAIDAKLRQLEAELHQIRADQEVLKRAKSILYQ